MKKIKTYFLEEVFKFFWPFPFFLQPHFLVCEKQKRYVTSKCIFVGFYWPKAKSTNKKCLANKIKFSYKYFFQAVYHCSGIF